ncbi:hypothetical protein HN873_019276, partial [Arachis hypogaea]
QKASAEKGRSGETGRVTPDGGGGKNLAISGGGYPCRPIVSWLHVIPAEELNADFAIVSSMEEWLLKVCVEQRSLDPVSSRWNNLSESKARSLALRLLFLGIHLR